MLYFGHFGVKKGHGQGLKGPNQNLNLPILPTPFLRMFQTKKFFPSTCQFCCYRCQRSCFFTFNPLFEFWLLFKAPHPITWQKYLPFSNAEFNSASIDINFNKIRQTAEEIACYFLLAPWRFSANY